MATTLNKPPHDAKGKWTKRSVTRSAAHMMRMFLAGKETFLGASRVDLVDGSHLTVIHHKAR